MSFTDLRPYVKQVMKAVDAELVENKEAFNAEKIPAYARGSYYFLTFLPATLVSFNQTQMVWDMPLTLQVWTKGPVDSNEAVDAGWKKAQAIVREMVRHSRRLTQTYIKNVTPRDCAVGAFDPSNENVVTVTLGFTFRVHMDTVT